MIWFLVRIAIWFVMGVWITVESEESKMTTTTTDVQVIVNLKVRSTTSVYAKLAACESVLDAVLRGQDNGFNHSYSRTVESIMVENVGCPHKRLPQ